MQIFSLYQYNEKQKEEEAQTKQLISELVAAKRDLNTAMNNFNYADSNEMVDIFSHQITIAQARYDLLIKRAKEHNLRNMNYSIEKVGN